MNKATQARIATERENSKKSVSEKRRALRRAIALRASHVTHENEHANRKATYVLEDHAAGARPSRKSTRKASNRIKESSTLDIRDEAVRSAPKERATRARTKNVRVRAH